MNIRGILKRPEIKRQQEEFAHWAIGLKQRTVQTVRSNQPLKPLMDEQRAYVLPFIAQVANQLIDLHKLKPQELIGYEMGSYAKGTCTAASDLDLNVAYEDGPRIYPFESNLRLTLAQILNLNPVQIHNNDLNLATKREDLTSGLPKEDLAWRGIRRRLVLKVSSFFYKRGIHTIGSIDLLNWVVWAAIRSPRLMALSAASASDRLAAGFYESGSVLNKAFIFGDRETFDAIKSMVDRSIDRPRIRAIIPELIERLDITGQRTPRKLGEKMATFDSAKTIGDIEFFSRMAGGYKTAFNLLFIIGFDQLAETDRILVSYEDFLSAQSFARVLGSELRERLFKSIDWLLKARTVISIYASGGTESSALAPVSKKIVDQDAVRAVLSTLNLNSLEDLKEAVGEKREVVQHAVLAAREKFPVSSI